MNGRVLRIQAGYNPNSSSIGTVVYTFVRGAAVFSVAAGALIAAVSAIKKPSGSGPVPLKRKKRGTTPPPAQ